MAIVGSLSAAVYRSRLGSTLTAAHVPGQVSRAATSSVAAANLTGARLGGAHGSELVAAAHSAFVASMSVGMKAAAGVALASAIGAFLTLRAGPRPQEVVMDAIPLHGPASSAAAQ